MSYIDVLCVRALLEVWKFRSAERAHPSIPGNAVKFQVPSFLRSRASTSAESERVTEIKEEKRKGFKYHLTWERLIEISMFLFFFF